MKDKQRKKFDEKDKLVSFSLSKEMSIPLFIKSGYSRHEVEILFEKLEEGGFGTYQRGKAGRNGAAKFVTNESCPDKFVLVLKVKRLNSDYIGKPEEKKPIVVDENGISKVIEKPLTEAEKILSIERKPAYVPTHLGTGYVCSITKNFVFVDRFMNGGFNSISDAIDDIWAEIKDYVSAKDSMQMTKKQHVVSTLMGVGFYKLNETPISNIPIIKRKHAG